MINIPVTIKDRPCRECGKQAVDWNKFNKVIQCHNCGMVVPTKGFTILVEGLILYPEGDVVSDLGRTMQIFHDDFLSQAATNHLMPSNVTFTVLEEPFKEEDETLPSSDL